VNPKFKLKADIDYFEIDEGASQADIFIWNLGVEYNLWKNTGLGLAYESVSLEGVDNNDSIDYEMNGIFAYVVFDFS